MTSSVRVCECAFFVPNDAQKGCIMQWHKLATINLLAQIKCSVLIIFFTFVIMQVVLLNIRLGQR